MRIDRKKFSKARPKIEQTDLEGGDFVVATVVKYEEVSVNEDGGVRLSPVLVFQEFGDKVLYLNTTQLGYLTERLGDESDRWIGKKIPLVKHVSMYQGDRFPKVWVAPPEEWDDLLAQDEPQPPAKRTPAKAVKKRRGK